MVKIYGNVLGRKGKLLGEGETLLEAVAQAYDYDYIKAYDELSREDYYEQIDVLVDYVEGAKQDYIIERG